MTILFGLPFVEQNGVDVALEMVDGDEGKLLREGKRFSVGNAHKESSGEARPIGDSDRVKIAEGDIRLGECGADNRDDGAEMLAGGQLGNHPAVACVSGNLGGDDGTEGAGAALDYRCGGLVTRGFDGEDEAGSGH
jgi:hypothetical protein